MKILLISHAKNDENAGASRVYHMLATALREKGHQVTLFHLDDLRLPKFLKPFVMRLALPDAMFLRFYREATQGYDIVFCSNGMAWKIFRKLRAQAKRPYLIHHIHGLTYFDYLAVVTERLRGHLKLSPLFMALKGRFPIKWDAEGARYADAIVAQNIRDQDYLEDQRALAGLAEADAAPIYQVPLALHPALEEASRYAVPPEERNPMTILWFGSWRERKGNYYVNRAFREVKKKFPQATLTLGGTGSDAASVEAFFDPALRSSVRVLPRVDIKTQVMEYNSHSIFIFPSLSEGFGLAPIEAMALGLACVTTQTGVGSDWIEDGRHAVVVTMASSEHLARGILKLMEDDALRGRIAREGQKLAKSFTLQRCVNEYLTVFDQCAAQAAPQA
jgi:glycosyltransferase involved in cell wall biosynthesis